MANRGLAFLAAATAAATATTVFTIAVIADYIELVHGIHLLSNRHLSMNLVKKIGAQHETILQSY
jgi:hypothetical protein